MPAPIIQHPLLHPNSNHNNSNNNRYSDNNNHNSSNSNRNGSNNNRNSNNNHNTSNNRNSSNNNRNCPKPSTRPHRLQWQAGPAVLDAGMPNKSGCGAQPKVAPERTEMEDPDLSPRQAWFITSTATSPSDSTAL
jgi:hypothetical protein